MVCRAINRIAEKNPVNKTLDFKAILFNSIAMCYKVTAYTPWYKNKITGMNLNKCTALIFFVTFLYQGWGWGWGWEEWKGMKIRMRRSEKSFASWTVRFLRFAAKIPHVLAPPPKAHIENQKTPPCGGVFLDFQWWGKWCSRRTDLFRYMINNQAEVYKIYENISKTII